MRMMNEKSAAALVALMATLGLFGSALAEESLDASSPKPVAAAPAEASSAPAPQADAAQPLDVEKLKAHFAQIVGFEASVIQEKKAPFLARPLKSEVSLSMKDGRILWRTLKPVASSIAIDGNGIHVESGASSGAASAMENAGKDPRAAAFIGFLRGIFALDFPAVEKDFVLSFGPGTMGALPRENSPLKAMIRGIEISFGSDLSITTVKVETPDETSTLRFVTFSPMMKQKN